MPNATDHQLKRLDHLQAAAQRLAGNSFLIKGWAITLVSAIIGFAVKDAASRNIAWVALVPVFVFWGLDVYYLALERLFRHMYNESAGALAAARYPEPPDGLPSPKIIPGSICAGAWFKAFCTPATSALYIVLTVAILLAARHII
jgi:hypothetical protein